MSGSDVDAADPIPIPDSAGEDIPPASLGNPDAVTAVTDPEADHRRGMDRTKLKFAIAFSSVSAAGAVVLGIIEYFTPGFGEKSDGALGATGDVLKLLATTSLGFVFGRTLSNGDS
ncbi:proton-conducting transporter membrane subunit [Rhodococcus erythropolis]